MTARRVAFAAAIVRRRRSRIRQDEEAASAPSAPKGTSSMGTGKDITPIGGSWPAGPEAQGPDFGPSM